MMTVAFDKLEICLLVSSPGPTCPSLQDFAEPRGQMNPDDDWDWDAADVPDTHVRAPREAESQDAEAAELLDVALEARPIDPQSTSPVHAQKRSTSSFVD